jgi:hypothetical protein
MTKALSIRCFKFFIIGFVIVSSATLFQACSSNTDKYTEVMKEVNIFPDYSNITLPPNIAPLNFMIQEQASCYIVKFHSEKGDEIKVTSNDGTIEIPISSWKKLLAENKGKKLMEDVFLKQNGVWKKYKTIQNEIATDSIDSYLAYRLIEPGFETWNKMGIYQRCLENFDEQPVMINDISDGNCMNCHSFCKNNAHAMLFHVRAKHGGTIIRRNGKMFKVDTKTDSTLSAGVYPSWHPGGRYIAFSVNRIVQSFHAIPQRKIEVVDTLSDLILFDAEKNVVLTERRIASPKSYETFPTWSPDGKYLYFCSAKFQTYKDYQKVKYDLLRIAFDPNHEKFGNVDTVISAAKQGYSVSFPRISPDGKLLIFCKTSYGNFTIWHDDSDLYCLDLTSGKISKPDINSNKSESYHNWSSTGRWLVFSSRRIDGLYTRPFFSYIDASGTAHKPFILPQRDPHFYQDFLKSYNVPELVTSKIELDPRILEGTVKSQAVKATFKNMN